MSDHIARYAVLMDHIIAWAGTRPDVKAVIVVGSRARNIQPADEWSDLDVVMFADTPEHLLNDPAWLSAIGEWEISFREPTAVGIWEERRVLFANGCDADFSILPASLIPVLVVTGPGDDLHNQTADVVGRGVRVLVDKDGRLSPALEKLAATAPPNQSTPTQDELDQILADFWYHCVWITRKLRRGEVMVAHECLEGTQRHILVTLLRWVGEGTGDTWHGTRFFERWVADDVQHHFVRTFARHDQADVQRALEEMMALVHRLAGELAEAASLNVDPQVEESARRWMRQALDG